MNAREILYEREAIKSESIVFHLEEARRRKIAASRYRTCIP